jgi:hypothetical protein
MGITPDKPGLFTLALLPNPFPTTVDSYHNSLWFTWIERVTLSHDAHADEIMASHGGSVRIDNEQQQEDADTLFTITESMYAAVIVAAQAQMESYHQKVCSSIYVHKNRTHELYAKNPKKKVSKSIKVKELGEYIFDNTNIDIKELPFFDKADAVRVLSNIFKHNTWRYKPNKSNTISTGAAEAIGVVPNQQVVFSDLPLRDLLICCGKFCQSLKQQLIKSLESDYA